MLAKIELLEKLAELRRADILNEDEYQRQKERVLGESDYATEAEPPTPVRPAATAENHNAEETDPHWDEPDGGRGNAVRNGLIGLAAAAAAAFFLIPGSPGARAIATLQWQAMSTPELEQEFMRAQMTAATTFLSCANCEGAAGTLECARLSAIVDDAIAMGEILCERDSSTDTCASARNLKELKQTMGKLSEMTDELTGRINDLTSYEPR